VCSCVEFGHIIEVYGFNPEMKTEDILYAFREFKSSGVDIKWIDDTHCLIILSSSSAGSQPTL
jgi:hypothetical protein